jgi:NAD-dependent SIR2 family protein deacetylase
MKAAELEKKLGKKKHKSIAELKQLLATRIDNNPDFCLFLGAGASCSSGIRSAGEMTAEWRAKVYVDLNKESALDVNEASVSGIKRWLSEHAGEWYDAAREYSSLIERLYPLAPNRRKFIEIEVAGKIPSIGYAYLVRLAENNVVRTIFTTNFDDLLNEAFYQLSSERALVCAHDSSVNTISITSGRTKIIKLHGDYLFEDIKNTPKETESLDTNMRQKLKEFLKEYGLIIVGYSGSDKSITRILEDMSDEPIYLENGLYWCFREEDEITAEALDILSKDRSFYVLTPGFDELMADFYSILPTAATPFNSKLASDRASSIIDSYLQSGRLKSSGSLIIRKHLEMLEADKDASLVSEVMKDLNNEWMASAGISDKNLLVFLEIERALKDRNPEMALAMLGDELAKSEDRTFKEILLRRRFACSVRLNKFNDARDAVKQMLTLEPANYYMALNECSLIENRYERIRLLEQLKKRHPFSSLILNRYAEEVNEAIEKPQKTKSGYREEDVVKVLKSSLDIDHSLENQAWSLLFEVYSKLIPSSLCLTVEILKRITRRNCRILNSNKNLGIALQGFFGGKFIFKVLWCRDH